MRQNLTTRPKHGPEWHIQKRLKAFLATRNWLVQQTHGNLYQKGFPDLFIAHRKWGFRWIDCKVDGHYSFTKAQQKCWPLWDSYGIGIWILVEANQTEYDKLFAPPNWRDYWKESYGKPDIDALLEAVNAEAEEA